MRGDFCTGGQFSGEGVAESVQYPCCSDGAAYTCALNTREQSTTAAVEVSTPDVTATAFEDQMATASSASTATISGDYSDLDRTAGEAGPLIAAPRPTDTSADTAGVEGPRNIAREENADGDTFAIKLTSALVDGTWVARSSSGASDVGKNNGDEEEKYGEDAGTSSLAPCELYLQLDDDTGDITAVPKIATTKQSADQPSEYKMDQAEARRRCGILVASGKQTDNSSTFVFAFVPSDNAGKASDEKAVIVRRGRTQLLTGTTSTTGAHGSTESASEGSMRTALAILWHPSLPDDGEVDGEGGAYSEAWVKKPFE